MVELRKAPFNLNDEQIKWVEDTKSTMTLDEKLGQLFVLLKAIPGNDEDMIKGMLAKSHQGGLRWQGGNAEQVVLQNSLFQKHSKIPLFVAANCDDGGSGCLPEGTFVATAVECGAGEGTDHAYHTGLVAGREASAIGCNWMFNPVADIYMNWRNTIVNTRAYGDNADTVIEQAKAYIRGIKDANPNMACTIKHFPGDGVEELDQHLALGVNNLSVEEWEASFGKVYRTMTNEGIEAVMVGHIALPEMSRKLRPGIKDSEIMPATLAPELMTELLRNDIGFNGLVITDASHMVGMTAMMKRADYVPAAIAAGADMFLFANDVEEDIAYMKAGYEKGIITEERLDDALTRILGMKAHLNLNNRELHEKIANKYMETVGCEEHKSFSELAAKDCITLVKDTKNNLPINVAEKKRVFLVYVQSTPTSKGYKGDPVKDILVEELEKAGFEVDLCPNYHDLEVANGVSPMNFVKMLGHSPRKNFVDNHDFVLLAINIKGYAQENNVRLRWSCNHSCELPWYNEEIPTIAMSLNYTNHLIDIPQVHTFINAYTPNRAHIAAAIEKMCGKSEFKGKYSETVFCDRWDTRL